MRIYKKKGEIDRPIKYRSVGSKNAVIIVNINYMYVLIYLYPESDSFWLEDILSPSLTEKSEVSLRTQERQKSKN